MESLEFLRTRYESLLTSYDRHYISGLCSILLLFLFLVDALELLEHTGEECHRMTSSGVQPYQTKPEAFFFLSELPTGTLLSVPSTIGPHYGVVLQFTDIPEESKLHQYIDENETSFIIHYNLNGRIPRQKRFFPQSIFYKSIVNLSTFEQFCGECHAQVTYKEPTDLYTPGEENRAQFIDQVMNRSEVVLGRERWTPVVENCQHMANHILTGNGQSNSFLEPFSDTTLFLFLHYIVIGLLWLLYGFMPYGHFVRLHIEKMGIELSLVNIDAFSVLMLTFVSSIFWIKKYCLPFFACGRPIVEGTNKVLSFSFSIFIKIVGLMLLRLFFIIATSYAAIYAPENSNRDNWPFISFSICLYWEYRFLDVQPIAAKRLLIRLAFILFFIIVIILGFIIADMIHSQIFILIYKLLQINLAAKSSVIIDICCVFPFLIGSAVVILKNIYCTLLARGQPIVDGINSDRALFVLFSKQLCITLMETFIISIISHLSIYVPELFKNVYWPLIGLLLCLSLETLLLENSRSFSLFKFSLRLTVMYLASCAAILIIMSVVKDDLASEKFYHNLALENIPVFSPGSSYKFVVWFLVVRGLCKLFHDGSSVNRILITIRNLIFITAILSAFSDIYIA